MRISYRGEEFLNLSPEDLDKGDNKLEILIDKSVAEIFVNNGMHYIVKSLRKVRNDDGLWFNSERYGPYINHMELFEMKSIWNTAD